MKELVQFIEEQVGSPIKNRWYTDTAPSLSVTSPNAPASAGSARIPVSSTQSTDLISCSQKFFLTLLSNLMLPFITDHCGTCTRCIEACPTDCILPNRTIDATRCISYLTIELKEDIPTEMRDKMGDWVFGCDICQMVCPWNQFAGEGDPAFGDQNPVHSLTEELTLSHPGV